MVLKTGIDIWDVHENCKLVEHATFSIGKLVPVTLKMDGGNTRQYSQSVRVNKGKLFMLVSAWLSRLSYWLNHFRARMKS